MTDPDVPRHAEDASARKPGPRSLLSDKPPRRFPAWLAIPVAALGGYMAADWPGAVFGVVAGYFLWRSRR